MQNSNSIQYVYVIRMPNKAIRDFLHFQLKELLNTRSDLTQLMAEEVAILDPGAAHHFDLRPSSSRRSHHRRPIPSAPHAPEIQCAICLNSIERNSKRNPERAIDCGHVYHQRCIEKWLEVSNYPYYYILYIYFILFSS